MNGALFKKLVGAAAALLLVLFGCLPAVAEETRVVRVGAFNYYPGIFRDADGVVKGFYVDTLAEIAKRENIRFEYVYGSWSEGLQRIKSGEVDLLTSVAYTPERAEFLEYARMPLLTVWSELYALPGAKIAGIRDVEERHVAVMKGDQNGRIFIDLVKKFNIPCTFEEVASFDAVFAAVASKEVDAGVVNSTYGFSRQKEYGLRSTGVMFNPFDIFFAVAKGKNRDVLTLLDSYLVTWRQDPDSPYNKARQRWSHGSDDRTLPRWLLHAVAALGLLVIGAMGFIVLLRRQVQRATADILRSKAVLRASEEKFRSYIDSSPDGVFVTDEKGRYVEVNAAASKITGYSQEELVTMSIPDLMPQESDNPLGCFETFKETDVSRSESEFVHRTGAKRWWSVDAAKLSDTRYLAFVKDITDRKRIEQTQLFLLQCGASPSGEDFFESLARYLARTLEMDYVCIDELYGQNLMARTLAIYFDGKFEDNVEYALQDTPCGAVAEKTFCIFPEDVRNLFPRDTVLQDMVAESYVGTTLWSCDGRPIGLIALIGRRPLPQSHLAESVLNLVAVRAAAELERRQAEKERSAIYERFHTMLDSLDALVYVADTESHTLLFVNAYGKKVFGDVEGQTCWRALQTSQPGPCEFCNHERSMAPERTPANIWGFRNTVTGRWYQCRDRSIRWHDNREVRLVIATDITDLKTAEEDLLQKNAELERFTYTVSHDLKSPLITIQTYAGMIVKDVEGGNHSRARADLQRIERAAEKMTTLLNDLLELSRIGRQMNPPVQIDMNLLVEDVLLQLAGLLEQRGVQITVDTDLPAVSGDAKRIGEVFQNLVENAVKYMGDQASPHVAIGVRRQGEERIFFVGDNGQGIPSRFHENIFGLFNQLDPHSEGTGVGLALVKRIVEVHGGRVWVESEGTGTGSRFCFTLESKQ